MIVIAIAIAIAMIITIIIIIMIIISNSNWTECSTIQGVVERVISKSEEREAQSRFKITSTILPKLYDTKSNY